MIDILASDTHHEVGVDEVTLRRKLKWYLKEEEINQLLFENFDLIVNNKNKNSKEVYVNRQLTKINQG